MGEDLVFLTFQYLEAIELGKIAVVNEAFRDVTYDELLWQDLAIKYWGEQFVAKKFKKYGS